MCVFASTKLDKQRPSGIPVLWKKLKWFNQMCDIPPTTFIMKYACPCHSSCHKAAWCPSGEIGSSTYTTKTAELWLRIMPMIDILIYFCDSALDYGGQSLLLNPSSTRYSCIPHRQFWEPLITMPVSTKQGLEKQKASGDLDPKSKNHRLLSWNISSHQGFYQDDATILSGTNLWNIMTPQVWSAVRARVVGWQSFQAKGERCNYFDFICAISLSHVAQKGHCGTIPEDNSTQFPPDSESQDPVARCYKFL